MRRAKWNLGFTAVNEIFVLRPKRPARHDNYGDKLARKPTTDTNVARQRKRAHTEQQM